VDNDYSVLSYFDLPTKQISLLLFYPLFIFQRIRNLILQVKYKDSNLTRLSWYNIAGGRQFFPG